MIKKEHTQYLYLILWIGVFVCISRLLGTVNKGDTFSTWYTTLKQSPLKPPRPVFGIVWPLLYTMIAASGWIIWRAQNIPSGPIIKGLFVAQILLNWMWMPLFFTYRATGWALVCTMTMIVLVGMLMARSYHPLKTVFYLLMPYLFWLCFAAYLNFYIWKYN